MAWVLKPTPVAQSYFGRNLKPASAAKLLIFSDFSFALTFQKVIFVFYILNPLCAAHSRLQFSSLISKSASRGTKLTSVFKSHSKVRFADITKSTSVFKSHLKVRSTRHKVDFGFHVTF
jgi:hypothetical protein